MDVTDESNRTYRLSLLSGIILLAVPISYLIGGSLFKYGGYMAVWGTALGVLVVDILYTIFYLSDTCGRKAKKRIGPVDTAQLAQLSKKSLVLDSGENGGSEMVKESLKARVLSVLKNLPRCFSVTFRRRAGYRRACITLLLASLCCAFLCTGGGSRIITQYIDYPLIYFIICS